MKNELRFDIREMMDRYLFIWKEGIFVERKVWVKAWRFGKFGIEDGYVVLYGGFVGMYVGSLVLFGGFGFWLKVNYWGYVILLFCEIL